MKKFFLLVLCLLVGYDLLAQNTVQELERYLDHVSADNSTPLPPAVLTDFQAENKLVELLISHRNDPGEDFQFRVVDLMRMIGLKSKKDDVRKLVVNHFVLSIADKNLRISGLATQAVAQFRKRDFTNINKDSLVSYLRRGMPNLDVLFRLNGYLEHPAAREKIASMLILPMSQTLKWNARLALARLGDENAISFILDKMSATNVDDAFIFSLSPGLVYTRERKIFAALERILQSDQYKCSSSHPDSNDTILCAYRLLEQIAPAIKNFPVRVDEDGDLLTDNYQSALVTARGWLKQNPDYELIRDTM
jgi:hypothetical protein